MRTVKRFVKSLVVKGYALEKVRAVALCTQWVSSMDEVEAEFKLQTFAAKKKKASALFALATLAKK